MNFWLSENYIEIFGAISGIIYVFLEIRQNIWLWPLGIITSGVYVWVFFTGKLYADMSLQVYYLVISVMGWYWWIKGSGLRAQGSRGEEERGGSGEGEKNELTVTRLKLKTGIILLIIFAALYFVMWMVLSGLTDSPVPQWDAFLTSLSIVATWMLARKIYEHWYLWIIVNSVSIGLFTSRGLFPTSFLFLVYLCMSFVGLVAWKRSLNIS